LSLGSRWRYHGQTYTAIEVEAVEVDIHAIDALLTFDLAGEVAHARAAVAFSMPGPGKPALDLRQPIDSLALDGAALDPDDFPHVDLGGGEGAEMRVLDANVDPGAVHELQLAYRLGLPDAEKAEAPQITGDQLHFDFWLSDLHPARYLEQWLPASLCGDRFRLTLHVEVAGSSAPHDLVSNGTVTATRPGRWTVECPATWTSLSPMVVIAPRDDLEIRSVGLDEPELILTIVRSRSADVRLTEVEASVRQWLQGNDRAYGPYCHGPRFTAFIWSSGRGMEYDGATTSSVDALEHEVFHSWFGRGIKPTRASDGWIDEAWTSWCTSSRRYEGNRFAVEKLGLDEEPRLLYPPHPWSRYTPAEAYDEGARLFAGLAYLLGSGGQLRGAMADWYQRHAGGFVTTAGLMDQLSQAAGRDLTPWFDRYVYGRD
jgi:hypothetical protein